MNADTAKRVAELSRKDWTVSQIAQEVGLGQRQVERYRKLVGVSKVHKVWDELPDEDKNRAREMLEEQASFTEVARTLGVSWKMINHHFGAEFNSWTYDQAIEYRRMLRKANKEMNKNYGKKATGWI